MTADDVSQFSPRQVVPLSDSEGIALDPSISSDDRFNPLGAPSIATGPRVQNSQLAFHPAPKALEVDPAPVQMSGAQRDFIAMQAEQRHHIDRVQQRDLDNFAYFENVTALKKLKKSHSRKQAAVVIALSLWIACVTVLAFGLGEFANAQIVFGLFGVLVLPAVIYGIRMILMLSRENEREIASIKRASGEQDRHTAFI